MSTEPIPEHVLKAAGRSAEFKALAMVNDAVAASGVTVETIASRLGITRRQVKNILTGRRVPTLRLLAEIIWAIDGSAISFSLESLA